MEFRPTLADTLLPRLTVIGSVGLLRAYERQEAPYHLEAVLRSFRYLPVDVMLESLDRGSQAWSRVDWEVYRKIWLLEGYEYLLSRFDKWRAEHLAAGLKIEYNITYVNDVDY